MTSGKMSAERFLVNELAFWETLKAVYVDGVQSDERVPISRQQLQEVKVMELATKHFEGLATLAKSLDRRQIDEITERVNKATGAEDLDPFDLESVKRWNSPSDLPIPPGRPEAPGPPQPPSGRSLPTGPSWSQLAFIEIVVTTFLVWLGVTSSSTPATGTPAVTVEYVPPHQAIDYGPATHASCEELEAMSYEHWARQLDSWAYQDDLAEWTTTFICGDCRNVMQLLEAYSHDWLELFPEGLHWIAKLLVYARGWECEQD